MLIRQARASDYPAILTLQRLNTPENLNSAQQQQGFIVSTMDEAQLASLNHDLGILVAEHDGQLAGFVCLSQPAAEPRPPVVDALVETLTSLTSGGRPVAEQRIFLYGPVCLAAQWRGKGVLKQLFAAVKAHTREKFDLGVLFIDQRNPHSLAAHVDGLGMHALTTFDCQGKRYWLLAFATNS